MSLLDNLHPELQRHVSLHAGWPFLHHWSSIGHVVSPEHVESINKCYAWKLERLADASSKDDWETWVFTHERAYRSPAFFEIAELITDHAKYWELLADVWSDSENIRQNKALWRECWNSNRPMKHLAMEEGERAIFDGLADRLTIYRGQDRSRLSGISWTLDREQAIWFARRRRGASTDEGWLLTATVRKTDVHAYLNGRNEREIVAEKAKVVARERVHGSLWDQAA